jgi:hypothetical protein
MTRFSTCFRTLLTLLIVLTGVSASQAGLFARWRTRYYYPTYSPAAVSTQQGTSAPTVAQPTASTTGPTVYTVAKPVIGDNAGAAPPAPSSATYVPATGVSTGSWSTLPRNSWDFGKFPPYSN